MFRWWSAVREGTKVIRWLGASDLFIKRDEWDLGIEFAVDDTSHATLTESELGPCVYTVALDSVYCRPRRVTLWIIIYA